MRTVHTGSSSPFQAFPVSSAVMTSSQIFLTVEGWNLRAKKRGKENGKRASLRESREKALRCTLVSLFALSLVRGRSTLARRPTHFCSSYGFIRYVGSTRATCGSSIFFQPRVD
jgi:hypothetical protein